MAGFRSDGRGKIPAFAAVIAMAIGLFLLSPSALALLSPALVLLLVLSLGLTPGEQLIERVHARRARSRRRRPAVRIAAPFVPMLVHSVGRKLAFALAMRPPPPKALPAF